eukprot:TRINITY_DN4677_c0_g1_i11.p1 TRINITY_DN4677_c0_g1~~TRINITY_DN4677_c0_g1_i11.p1  ORF type:complete len:145 (+),score=37.44 TRINITY_DN4677_c0_g1_i11:172-606(+)
MCIRDSYYTGYLIVCSQAFSRKDNIYIKFKVTGEKKTHLFVGVAAQEHKDGAFWFSSGNQICLFQNYDKASFKKIGQDIRDIYKSGTIYEVEFNIENNKLIVQDEEKKSICQNEKQFENNENWVFVLGTNSVEIECEIIESRKW